MNEKYKLHRYNGMMFVGFWLIFIACIINGLIFYFKYSQAKSDAHIDYKQRAVFVMESIMDRIGSENNSSRLTKLNEIYKDLSLPYQTYLLKFDAGGVLRVVSTPDTQFQPGDEFIHPSCGNGLASHNFNNKYTHRIMRPENRVSMCIFQRVGEYIFGFNYIFPQTLSDMDDPDFKEWLIKNMSISFIASSSTAFMAFVWYTWISMRFLRLREKFVGHKKRSIRSLKSARNNLYADPLTGISNKNALENDIAASKKPKVVVVDIDDFSRMNNYYGRSVCDRLLLYLSELLREFAKNEHMKLYIISADQFVLFENGDFFIDRYEELANELKNRFKGRIVTIKDDNGKNIDIEIHTTIGFALDKDDTLMKALTALKMAKLLKKDFVCYFKGLNKSDEYAEQISRSNIIRKAIINNNIVPFYQPIYDINSQVVKYECLIRIMDSGEIISPYIFLSTSKQIKRYAELQKMIISKAVERLNENENLILSVNLSGRDMIDGDVSMHVVRLLNQFNVAERLVFEIVEDENIENAERIENFIDKVKNMGAKIAIDDFGSGYSNFSYILKLNPDYIKIDGSIIKNIDTNKDSYTITRAIVTFAKDLGIKTIAEYIHSKEVFDICKELGVDEYQGFYLGAPSDKTM
ncbi:MULTISPECIES: EAL domain-containing protein [unclassified Campylobacter]|uniref:EAL domain-containing protein n=1 Tax=unclassified Campylobacter TaxID=2593542 RepID=UPI003D3429F9